MLIKKNHSLIDLTSTSLTVYTVTKCISCSLRRCYISHFDIRYSWSIYLFMQIMERIKNPRKNPKKIAWTNIALKSQQSSKILTFFFDFDDKSTHDFEQWRCFSMFWFETHGREETTPKYTQFLLIVLETLLHILNIADGIITIHR